MLEVHPAPDAFTVFDTEGGEHIINFASRSEADELNAAKRAKVAIAGPRRWWHIERFSGVY